MKKVASWALALLLTVSPFGALAGSLKVVPIKVFLDDPSATAGLTLTNEGQDRITVQLDAKAWDQDDQGADQFSVTTDIVFFPRMLELEPAARQIIRIGYQGEDAAAAEKAYRIFLQELPVAKPGEMALRFAITMSIPVFVRPDMEHGGAKIEEVTQKHGRLHVTARNDGNTHVVVGEITINGLDAAGRQVFTSEARGWYLLANRSKTYDVPVPEDGCEQAARIEVNLLAGNKTITSLSDADTSQCAARGNAQGEAADEHNRQDATD